MERRYGVRGTVCMGIFFTEDNMPSAVTIKQVSVEISRQNLNLLEVKKEMANQASKVGANAIMNFRYGQRKHDFMKMLSFRWDSESWHGEGIAVKITE